MARLPLNLDIPLHQETFKARQDYETLRGGFADVCHALSDENLMAREAFLAEAHDIKAQLIEQLRVLRELESQLDPAYRMQHDDVT